MCGLLALVRTACDFLAKKIPSCRIAQEIFLKCHGNDKLITQSVQQLKCDRCDMYVTVRVETGVDVDGDGVADILVGREGFVLLRNTRPEAALSGIVCLSSDKVHFYFVFGSH